LTILIEPGTLPKSTIPSNLDPALLADFNDTKSGPIMGVSARDFAKGQ
jgi:hypothetical protein